MVLNVNVPNVEAAELRGWRHTEVGTLPQRAMAVAALEPMVGHEGAYSVRMTWGDAIELPDSTDVGAVESGDVSLTYLTRLQADRSASNSAVDQRLTAWLKAR